jgi:hypothetical protein
MKTVKFLSFLITIALFTINLANAQPKNYSIITEPYTGPDFCGTETVAGTRTTEMRWNKNMLQIKVSWCLVGQTTGYQYEPRGKEIHILVDNCPNGTSVQKLLINFHVRRNNEPWGYGHLNLQVTTNANGDITAEFLDQEWSCIQF